MSIKIRPITVSDKDRWLELFKEYIVFYKSHLTDEQFELTWQRLNSGFNREVADVIVRNLALENAIHGYIGSDEVDCGNGRYPASLFFSAPNTAIKD